MIEFIGKVKMNMSYYCGEELYSDGEAIEDELLDIVKNYSPKEYNRIIKERKNWPILYHLSEVRGNIIEWLPFQKNESVLEIGSGCGAITGVLSDKVQKVTCIELSKKRSTINAYRHKEKDNIEIIVGNFEDIEIKEKFDYITLIGVFEYAESYIHTDRPYVDLLKKVSSYLNSNGKLIIAIENKFGLKYWAGCMEDHFGKLFEGIEGYTSTQGVKTFSKTELQNMFKECGMPKYKFYYPYPDYKLPQTIYSDQHLPKEGELNINMTNFDAPRIQLFDEQKSFNSILRSNMFPWYSNSYLIIIDKDDN